MDKEEKISGYKTLFIVWSLLIFATMLIIVVSRLDLGGHNVWITLLIAAAKCSLVLFFFMNLRFEQKSIRYMLMIVIVLISLFISFMFFDTSFR